MHYLGPLALTALLFGSALAAPLAEAEANKPKHPKPTPTPGPVQGNSCGNGATAYCCNGDGFASYTTCSLYYGGNVCSGTTVCCNANNSVQVCLGNAVIV